MTILQQPDALSFSMNLKPFKISATADVVFSLSQGDAVLLSQILSPDADGQVEISLRDVIHDRLSCQVPPTADPYQQSSVAADFTAVIDGQSVTFRVIRGGVDRLSGTVTDFLKANFLTWQPNVKPVTYSSPEFLSYYAVSSGCSLKVKAWFTDASGNATAGATKTICSLTKGVVTTVSVQYAVIAGLYAGSLPAYYDVWVASGSTALTYTQRYYANVMQSEEEQWIFFENSLGGIDTFRTFGAVSLDAEHTHHIAEIDDVAYEYRVDTERKWTVNTGHLDILERRWLLDFFPSAGKYVYAGSAVRRIVLTEDSVSYRFRELPSSYSFTFRFAEALPLLNLPRHELPVEMLDITVPDIGSFTLPPRLLEFSRLPLSEGVLFPVQSPYAEEWGVATLAGIAQYVSSLIDIPSPGISRNDIIRLLSAQLTPLDPLHPEDSLIDPSWLPESYGGTTDISHVAGLQNALDTLTGQLSNKLDVRFFNSIFTVYDSDGNAIVPNTYTQVADNLRILVGTWTDEYLSALGKNPSGGGSGGTGSVNSIKVATNAYLDPDSNGIIDMSGYVVSSADRTRWDAAASGGHTHSNKSVLDSITAAKISSWDAVASIMGSDSDTVINKWNEVVAFLDTYTEADTLANLLSNKLDVRFFNSIFTVYDSDGNAIVPNTYTQVADNLRILVGTWTDEYLSALGKNPSGGGSGGTGSVNSILVSSDYYDSDENGIVDLSAAFTPYAKKSSLSSYLLKSDISAWAKAASKPSYDLSELGGSLAWDKVSSTPKTLSGYGITDAAIANGEITLGNSTITPVTSVAMSVPTGFSVSGSPVSKTGTLELSYASGYEGFTTALKNKINLLYSLFTREGSGTSADPYVIKANYGLYTDDFLSALGKNPSGGGSGGTGSVNSIKVAANVFRDPDSDGIIDLTADIVSSADRTRWNAAATNSHTHSNKSVLDGITAGKVSSWDAVASIMGSDSDTVINKWNEVVAFLDTYTEADTLANLLSNKADKSDVYSASTSRTKNYVLAAPSSQNGAASFRKLVSADIPDLSSSYATASRATALEGYFTNGVAKTAAKLSTVSKTAWGKTFWTSGGVPQDVDGTLTISGGELMIWNTADTSAENRWDMRFAWSGEIFQMWAYEDAYHDLSIGSTAAATATYKGLYYDASEKRWGIGTSTPAYTLDVKGPIATTGAITLAGTTEAARRIYFGDTSHYIELDADGYFHFSHGLYSDSFVSALGKNPSGGGSGTGSFDEESMWTALGTTVSAKVIAASHIPSLAASKITSGTLAAARIPALAIAKISGLQDALDNVYTKTASDGRYYALYGGTDLSPSSSKAVDLNTILDTGSYFISNASNAKYVSNRPVTGGHDFRLWVTATTGTSANYKRQRYARYDNNNVYERYTTNGGTSWSTWELVQDNLANYASASSLDGYLPLSGGTMNNGVAICWKDNPSSGTASDLSLVSFSTTNNFHLGYDAATFGYNTYINGNQVYLRYGSSRTVGLTLSSEGAVSIANGLGTGSYIDVDRSPYGAVSLGYQLNVLRARCKNAGTGTFAYNSVISLFGSGETGTTVNNLGVRLGSQSGATWISAGESGKTLSSKYTDMCNTESVYITADNQIKFFTNCSNDGTSFTDAATINSSGDLTVARYVYATTFHGALSGNATTATTATKLSTVSKTAWGQTYWTSGGIPTNISGNLSSVDNIYMANAKTIFIKDTDGTDRSILNLSSNNNVNLGYGAYNLGTGTYIYGKTLVVRIGGTSSTYNALSIDAEKDATFAGSVTASSFIGNASTATTLKTARSIWGQSFNGGAAVNGTLFMISGEEGSTVNTASAKLKFNSHNTNETMRSPYIQGVGGSSYGRKRLGFFQSNATNYTDDFVEAMSIMPTGRVGIGTTAPSYLLHVNGTMAGKECRALSDIRRKDIIGEIHISVADIAAAPSILFTWKDGTDKAVHGGTTAQYWQPIAPCYVNEGDDGALDLNYAGLALSASIENSKLLLTHDTEIELLKKENRELKMRVRKLERRVA